MSDRKKLKMVSSIAAVERTRAGEASARSTAAAAAGAVSDTEVRAVAKRRQFTAAYKLAVLEEADRANDFGAIGALLRREGLYSSHLSTWRRERETGALVALGRTRGRKAKFTPEQKRLAALQGENTKLKRELEQAHIIIDVQKKLCTLLGLPTAAQDESFGSES